MKRVWILVVVLFAYARSASADDVDQARVEFVSGVELAGKGRWGDALAAFERSTKLHPHALTTYNVATCERALGAYTRARRSYANALAENERAQLMELPASFVEEAKARRAEIDGLLPRLDVTLAPADAAIAVDGRPLAIDEETHAMVAGIAGAGSGAAPPSARFKLLVDPGPHVFTLQNKGFAPVIVNRAFEPSSQSALVLEMAKLPATIRVAASRPSSVVVLDGHDVGIAPVDLVRPAGTHALVVTAIGYEPYRSTFSVHPGEQLDLRAPLAPTPPGITKRWWFWTGIGAVAAGIVVTSVGVYFATRTREPPDGGSLGWVAPAGP
jgi:hypothetical protein